MDINRVSTSGLNLQLEQSANGAQAAKPQTPLASPARQSAESRIEALQNAMRELPDVETDKIIAIRKALASGEISTDAATLAKLMMSYHRSTDV